MSMSHEGMRWQKVLAEYRNFLRDKDFSVLRTRLPVPVSVGGTPCHLPWRCCSKKAHIAATAFC